MFTTSCVFLFKQEKNPHVVDKHANVLRWSPENRLQIDKYKCNSACLIKSRNQKAILLASVKNVNELKFLGVTINEKLNHTSATFALVLLDGCTLFVC